MHTSLGLHVSSSVDPTAIATLLLASITGLALLATRSSLKQTKEEIDLSRTEVEEAHRPVVVPVIRRAAMEIARLGTYSVEPQALENDVLIIPIENIGSGPALDIVASVDPMEELDSKVLGPTSRTYRAGATGLGVGGFMPLEFGTRGWEGARSFDLTIEYDDVAGKSWRTHYIFVAPFARYEQLGITACERKRIPSVNFVSRPLIPKYPPRPPGARQA